MLAEMRQEIDSLKKMVAKLNNIKIVGFSRRESARGISFSGGEPVKGNIGRPKTVVIVRAPVAGDASLLVREAKYASWPPKPCTKDTATPPVTTCYYEWYGDPFDIYPPIGRECIDYAGDEWNGANEPKLDTVFHSCHREHDVWVLDERGGGGGETGFAIVRGTYGPGADARKVSISEITVGANGVVSNVGAAKDVRTWPGLYSENYAAFRWTGTEIKPETIIISVTRIGEQFYAEQWSGLRYRLLKRARNVRVTDCIPQEVRI